MTQAPGHRPVPPRRRKTIAREIAADENGQAMVESALVIPLMTFLILGVVQLVMMQHARIMTEYAAFNAARAGIVWNADRIIMENAAIISLLPTYEGLFKQSDLGNPTQMLKRIVQRAALYQKNRRLPEAIDLLKNGASQMIGQLPVGQQGKDSLAQDAEKLLDLAETMGDEALRQTIASALGPSGGQMVEVKILSPKMSSFGTKGREIDFDDPQNRDTTRLTVEVRYLYMMRVPFANWIISQAWLAGKAGKQLYGAIWNPQEQAGETGLRSVAPVQESTFADPDLKRVSALARHGIYMVPIKATYTMRMQSNPYKQSLEVK